MAQDGSSMDVADEVANAEFFGYPGNSQGNGAFPQLRILALVECGTHAVVAASMAPFLKSEQAMAAQLLERLAPDMLVLADRNFYGFKLWQKACTTGARMLWRMKASQRLPREQILSDRIWTPRISQALTHCCQEGKDCTRISGLVVARATVPDGNRWWRSYRFNALQVPRSYRISSTTV
jgi:hypothetical protein